MLESTLLYRLNTVLNFFSNHKLWISFSMVIYKFIHFFLTFLCLILISIKVMQEVLGFSIQRKVSKVITAGTGVFVCNGRVKRGALVTLYPGKKKFIESFHNI